MVIVMKDTMNIPLICYLSVMTALHTYDSDQNCIDVVLRKLLLVAYSLKVKTDNAM
jgi:hypothetical protein